MRNGPARIILIRAGKYDYAEAELNGSLQIVGPNNTGKTTLINTLQFLYVDDRREMSFGPYSLDQTLEYYFPGHYSYVLFECHTARGLAVVGWRGNSRASGAGPERFYYLGPYQRSDFMADSGKVLEPEEVSANLADHKFELLPKAQQHREMLLSGIAGRNTGLGIVSLKDNDKYHQFRETLKNLLSLTAISQDQMRERLLMLAEIPTDAVAVDRRRVLGDDHDRLMNERASLDTLKKHGDVIQEAIGKFRSCQQIRGELMYRWTNLKSQKATYEAGHATALSDFDEQIAKAETDEATARAQHKIKGDERDGLIAQRTTLENELNALAALATQFAGFPEELERATLARLDREVEQKRMLIEDAASETIEAVESKLTELNERISVTETAIQHFDALTVTDLRRDFSEDELAHIFGILNPELLKLPLGAGGVAFENRAAVTERLRQILTRTWGETYHDEAVTIRFAPAGAALSTLQDVEKLRGQLDRLVNEKERTEKLKDVVLKRKKHQGELDVLMKQKQAQAARVQQFDKFQVDRGKEAEWRKQLTAVGKSIGALDTVINGLNSQIIAEREKQTVGKSRRKEAERQRGEVMKRFGECRPPIFDAKPAADAEIPDGFESAIARYLHDQGREKELAHQLDSAFGQVQRFFGDAYQEPTQAETIRKLTEEIEAAGTKEEALRLDWNAHIQGLRSRFKQVLDDLGHVQTAATAISRRFADVQVSDLKGIKLTAEPHADTLAIIKGLVGLEELDLWADQAPLETVIKRTRDWLDETPVVRVAELFGLIVSVTGADGKVKHYKDFTQIESDGTTVTIKVLFNLLVLKSLMRKDDVAVPFFLDEIEKLDPSNRRVVLETSKALGFIAITAAPSAVGEVDACYFLEKQDSGHVRLTYRLDLEAKPKRSTLK